MMLALASFGVHEHYNLPVTVGDRTDFPACESNPNQQNKLPVYVQAAYSLMRCYLLNALTPEIPY